MKRSEYSAWLRNLFAMIAIIALFGFGMTPRAARASCAGDCDGSGQVTVDEILTLVNIALSGSGTCPNGIPEGVNVDVALILTAVNNDLNGTCKVTAICGDGVKNGDEDCDLGGTCLGGTNAGTHCTSEDQCQGFGVCEGGEFAEVNCDPTNSNSCPGGTCKKCQTQGGAGCASNCTTESQVVQNLVPGVVSGGVLQPGTGGSVVYTDGPLGALVLPFKPGTTQTLAVGKPKDGFIPYVVLADTVHYPAIDVGTIACACVRGVADKTCGGYLTEANGDLAIDCTPGFTPGTCSGTASPQNCSKDSDCTAVTLPDKSKVQNCFGGICANCRVDSDCTNIGGGTCNVHACDGKNPCAFVSGPGTGGAGVIGCAAGLPGVNMYFHEDSKGSNDPIECDPNAGGPNFVPPNPAFPICGDAPVIELSGTGPAGSSIILNTTAISNPAGTCPAQGATFCTDAEPFSARSLPQTLPSVTGIAEGIMFNANQIDGDTICNCPAGITGCDVTECIVDATHPHGGHSSLGILLPSGSNVCSQPFAASVTGLGVAGAFTSLSNNTTDDIVVTNLLPSE